MVKKIVKVRPKKVPRLKRREVPLQKIKKKPYSDEERTQRLQEDLLRIAKRYEGLRLYDEAISYYKKVGKGEDIERLLNIKKVKYLPTAQEFEAMGKYEDAARLYENLGMEEDLNRIKKMMGNDETEDDVDTAPSIPSNKPEEEVKINNISLEHEPTNSITEPENENLIPEIRSIPPPEIMDKPIDSEIDVKKSEETTTNSEKGFKICPFCGEELNLPKKPNFCPFCTEKLV